MKIFIHTGNFKNGTKISELISYLQGHVDMYGDTKTFFLINGDENVDVQFEHYKNALAIHIEEKEDEEE